MASLQIPTPAVPGVDSHGFEFLDTCHRDMAQNLVILQALAASIEADGVSAETQKAARQLCAWFNETARDHHQDEEKHVFPPLLTSGDEALVQQVERLIQDHGWLEEDWIEIEPTLSAIADGYQWFEPAEFRHAVEIFRSLYLDHIALEESLAYPKAREQLDALALASMQEEMMQRRTRRSARSESRRS